MEGSSRAGSGMSEADPVERHEFLLRRIHFHQYKERPRDPILRTAFTPAPNDTDGLSVYRETFCTACELAEAASKPSSDYYVVRLCAGDVLDACGCTLRPDPRPPPSPAGHTLIPEISRQTAKASRELQLKLTELANGSRGAIVWKRGVPDFQTPPSSTSSSD
jgi:hypothetical protein